MSDLVAVKHRLKGAVSQNSAFSKKGLQERIFAHAFTDLVYPQIWEDPYVDMQALQIKPYHNLVCIASGGCNVMSYLTKGPSSITAVDLSPAHIALLKLKLAAAKHMPNYKAFNEMFVHANTASNINYYDGYLKTHLDEDTQNYWDSRFGLMGRKIDMFGKGFYRFGLLGKFISTIGILARFYGVNLKDFTECRTLSEQRDFFNLHIEPIFDSRLLRFIANNRLSLFGLGIPPQQYDELAAAGNGDIIETLKQRTRALMCDYPLGENYFAWQAFAGGYQTNGTGPLPPYLQAKNLHKLRNVTDRVDVRNETFTDYLSKVPAKSKHGFVLLDAQDWMTNDQLNALWAQITRTAASDARVIYRTAGIPDILQKRVDHRILARWDYLKDQSEKLHKQDRSAIYGGFHIYQFRG